MRYIIKVMLKPDLVDIQGSTVKDECKFLGYNNIQDIRIGKVIEIVSTGEVDIQTLCDTLLVNSIIETYSVEKIE